MKVYNYTLSNAEAGTCPFADEFGHDRWVAYHGTSNYAEALIESQGIFWQDEIYSKSQVSAVVDIFDRLHWYGREQGGFGVLASFAQADFQKSNERNRKPIFLAKTSFRSLYASREWAGGETARALRLALRDLYEYLNNATLENKPLLSLGNPCVTARLSQCRLNACQEIRKIFPFTLSDCCGSTSTVSVGASVSPRVRV